MTPCNHTDDQYTGLICCAIRKLIADTTRHGLPSLLISSLTTAKPMRDGLFVYQSSLTSPASDLEDLFTKRLAIQLSNAQVDSPGYWIGTKMVDQFASTLDYVRLARISQQQRSHLQSNLIQGEEDPAPEPPSRLRLGQKPPQRLT